MIKRWLLSLIIPVMIVSSSCGLLYTNVTRPHSRDFNNTPIGSKKCTISAYKVQVPIVPLARSRISAEWNTDSLESILRSLAAELNLKTGVFFGLLRVATTGRTAAPPLFQTMEVLGKELCLKRLTIGLDRLTSYNDI